LVALTQADVVSSWAGLRPLIANPDGSPSDISRAHQICCPEPGWWDIAGGKLTTYRLMAEQAVDQLVRHVGRTVIPCRTAGEPLLPPQETTYSGILPAPLTRAAVDHYLNQEWAVHLDDVMVRRSGWHYYHTNSAESAGTVASWMAEFLGWSGTERERELSAYRLAVGQETIPTTDVPASRMEVHR